MGRAISSVLQSSKVMVHKPQKEEHEPQKRQIGKFTSADDSQDMPEIVQ